MTLIGITDEDFQLLITQAYKRGWEECHSEEWLEGRDAIIDYLSKGKNDGRRMSLRTFREHLAAGHFGNAVQNDGKYTRARKSELDAAWGQYMGRAI